MTGEEKSGRVVKPEEEWEEEDRQRTGVQRLQSQVDPGIGGEKTVSRQLISAGPPCTNAAVVITGTPGEPRPPIVREFVCGPNILAIRVGASG